MFDPALPNDDLTFPSDRGICDLCEVAPVDGDDCFCALCRIEVTAMSAIVVDPVERALNAHWNFPALSDQDSTTCRCGLRLDGGPGFHRRHLAEVIRAVLGLEPPEPWKPASDEITE